MTDFSGMERLSASKGLASVCGLGSGLLKLSLCYLVCTVHQLSRSIVPIERGSISVNPSEPAVGCAGVFLICLCFPLLTVFLPWEFLPSSQRPADLMHTCFLFLHFEKSPLLKLTRVLCSTVPCSRKLVSLCCCCFKGNCGLYSVTIHVARLSSLERVLCEMLQS